MIDVKLLYFPFEQFSLFLGLYNTNRMIKRVPLFAC